MESPGRRRVAEGLHPGPGLGVEIELIDVVEPLLVLVYASKNEHRALSGASRVPVATFDVPFHAFEL